MVNAGWYEDGTGSPRWWDGYQWTEHRRLAPSIVSTINPQPHHVSGLTTGQNIMHAILTVITLGIWAPLWWLSSRLGRRRIR
jgi:hypothetical protein